MIEIKCKHCNNKVTLRIENEKVLEHPLMKDLLEVPCTDCVSPEAYVEFLMAADAKINKNYARLG